MMKLEVQIGIAHVQLTVFSICFAKNAWWVGMSGIYYAESPRSLR